jgi:hypothetical protein
MRVFEYQNSSTKSKNYDTFHRKEHIFLNITGHVDDTINGRYNVPFVCSTLAWSKDIQNW